MPIINIGGVDHVEVTVRIPLQYARYLRSFASYGRYCDQTIRALDALYAYATDGGRLHERGEELYIHVSEDVGNMKQPMSAAHSILREAFVADGVKPLWDQNQG